jgi:hypothetical protein
MKFGPCFIDERYKMCVKKTLPIPAVVKTSLNFAFLRLAFVFPAQQVLLPRTDCWLPDHLAHLMREYGDRVFNKAPFPFSLNYRQHITVTNGIESRYISTSELHLCLSIITRVQKVKPKMVEIDVQCQYFSIVLSARLKQDCK